MKIATTKKQSVPFARCHGSSGEKSIKTVVNISKFHFGNFAENLTIEIASFGTDDDSNRKRCQILRNITLIKLAMNLSYLWFTWIRRKPYYAREIDGKSNKPRYLR